MSQGRVPQGLEQEIKKHWEFGYVGFGRSPYAQPQKLGLK